MLELKPTFLLKFYTFTVIKIRFKKLFKAYKNMNYLRYTKQYIESKFFIFLFFILYFLIGTLIFKDYSISFDENINRTNGLISLKFIIEKFNLNIDLNSITQQIPDLYTYIDKNYGVAYDLPVAMLELLFGFKDTRDIYLFRHFLNFLLFFASTICFYHFINQLFKNKVLSLVGLILLILSPRIFAESFYNPKDIVLMSLIIFGTYYNLKFLKNESYKYIFLGALFSSLITDVRIVGAYFPILTILIFVLNQDGKNIKESVFKILIYLSTYLLFTILFWPLLWENPFDNFIESFTRFQNYPWLGEVLYFGEFVKAKFLPWHYFFVWFAITTPLIFLLIIFFGVIKSLIIFIYNLANIEKSRNNVPWKDNYEMTQVFILFIFLIPIFMVIFFNSTLYTGWRQLYFVYPSLILLGLFFLNYLYHLKNKIFYRIFILFIAVQSVFTSFYIYKIHPHQHTYFNFLSNKFVNGNFPIDYWGLSNQFTIEKILKQNKLSYPIKISSASFTDLNKTKLIMKKSLRDQFVFVEYKHDEADYIFTNNYYFYRPLFNKKRYSIPNYYKPYYQFEIEGKVINKVFVNTKKIDNK